MTGGGEDLDPAIGPHVAPGDDVRPGLELKNAARMEDSHRLTLGFKPET
jgi:hypothetical protein